MGVRNYPHFLWTILLTDRETPPLAPAATPSPALGQNMNAPLISNDEPPTAAAEAKLALADPRLAELIERIGPCPLGTLRRDPFDALVVAIVGQQLSTKAAATLRERLQTRIGAARPFEPGHFRPYSAETLQGAGLSGAKARALLHLAAVVERGELDLAGLAGQADEAVIAALVGLPGIGRWTAEMLLIFSLGRPDVLSMTDSGLRRAARRLYGLPDRDDEAFQRLAEGWRPYRSVASWYLWRFLDQPP